MRQRLVPSLPVHRRHLCHWAFRGALDMPEVKSMKIARKVAVVMATAMLSVGLLGISAPAHADWGWYSVRR
ncbi:hypothetical protein GCM10023350_34320 [Nocardioides endophyticus]|uniref:Uncharacterized protein n=1 Tax=Nocardioides endophyticus TaxID=1353775 RepID=A0ABP8Z535_9ACTN